LFYHSRDWFYEFEMDSNKNILCYSTFKIYTIEEETSDKISEENQQMSKYSSVPLLG
jgi:hypothetical protein